MKARKAGGDFWSGKGANSEYWSTKFDEMVIKKNNTQNISQKFDVDYYYDAVDGMIFNDGTIMSRNNFEITLNTDLRANARYLGFKNGKHHVNFSLSDYEITPSNIRATMIHEAYGHGVKNYSGGYPGSDIFGGTHHKAYFTTIDSKYWNNTTLAFKKFTMNYTHIYHFWEKGNIPLPIKYSNWYGKYYKFSN